MATASLNGKKAKEVTHDVAIKQIEADADLQPRDRIDLDVVMEYSEAMMAGDTFPPIIMFFDGVRYWLADGFHRLKAAIKANLAHIRAVVYQGTKDDAILYSVGANASNGLRRSSSDKRRAVIRMLSHPEWCLWTDTEIARRCRVSQSLVHRTRGTRDDLPGHGVKLRVAGNGELVSVKSEASETPERNVSLPPIPLTKKELTDTYVRKVGRSIKKTEGKTEEKVETPFGAAEIVSPRTVYVFGNAYTVSELVALYGKASLARGHIGRDYAVVVGNFSRACRVAAKQIEDMVGNVAFRAPEAVIAEMEGGN